MGACLHYKDPARVNQVLNLTSLYTGHQSTIRLMTKLQFLAGLAMKATDVINTNVFPQVQDLMGEITTYVELCTAAITGWKKMRSQMNKEFMFLILDH